MLDNLMGNLSNKQEEIQKELKETIIDAQIQDGAIKVQVNADKEILNITIDDQKLNMSDKEQIEDLLITVINDAIAQAKEKEQALSGKLLGDILPPGFGNLFG